MIESKNILKEHFKKCIKDNSFIVRKEFKLLSSDEIAEKEYFLSQRRILIPEHKIFIESGEEITVQDILDNPNKQHEQCCKDPYEPDYGTSTIAKIYSDQEKPVIFSFAHGGLTYHLQPEGLDEIPNFQSIDYQNEYFYLAVYNKKNEIYHINGNYIETFSHAGFLSKFNCYKVKLSIDDTSDKGMSAAKSQLNNPYKKCITDDGFHPSKPLIYQGDNGLMLNEYVPAILRKGFAIPNKNYCEESAKLWTDHISRMLHRSEDAEILIDYFAFLIQFPNERQMFSPLIISSVRGVGKDIMTDIFSKLLGYEYCKKSNIDNLSKLDAWGDIFYRSKLITVSECGSDKERYTIGNALKDAITAISMTMNLKGKDIVNESVYCGMIFFSNYRSPFRLDEEDRRFFITRCDQTKEEANILKESGYFNTLFSYYSDLKRLNGLCYYLLNRNISTNMK